jgi:hypothetical protein
VTWRSSAASRSGLGEIGQGARQGAELGLALGDRRGQVAGVAGQQRGEDGAGGLHQLLRHPAGDLGTAEGDLLVDDALLLGADFLFGEGPAGDGFGAFDEGFGVTHACSFRGAAARGAPQPPMQVGRPIPPS